MKPPILSHESKDSLGFGRLVEGQLRATLQLIKQRRLLSEPPPSNTTGRGIVIAAGGKYADWGLVNCKFIRDSGINLPIQVWHLGPNEIQSHLRKHFQALDAELVDAFEVRRTHWHRKLSGWTTKQFAAMRAPWREVLSVDADCFIAAPPEHVFDDPDFQQSGALFCKDVAPCRKSNWAYFFAGIPVPEQEMESGYFAWDRVKAWEGIKMTHWIAEHSEVWDKHIYGDKDRPALGFGSTGTPYVFADQPEWIGSGIRHHWKGKAICDHLMAWKRGDAKCPHPVIPRLFEWVRSLR